MDRCPASRSWRTWASSSRIGGYAILEARDKEEAIELIERSLAVHGDEWNIECEVRPLDRDTEIGAEA
jgi:hypothetical protein